MGEETETIIAGALKSVSNDRENRELKVLYVKTAATVDAADTFTVNLANYGGSTLLAVDGYRESTAGSVIVSEAHTTSVSGTTVTVTIAAGTDNFVRGAKIFYY